MKIYSPSNYSYVKIIEIPKEEISKLDMALCAQPRQTLKQYYDSCAVKPTILTKKLIQIGAVTNNTTIDFANLLLVLKLIKYAKG